MSADGLGAGPAPRPPRSAARLCPAPAPSRRPWPRPRLQPSQRAPADGPPRRRRTPPAAAPARSRAGAGPSSPNRRTRGGRAARRRRARPPRPRHSTVPVGLPGRRPRPARGHSAEPPRQLRATARSAAARRALSSSAVDPRAGSNRKPRSRPTNWPSTVTVAVAAHAGQDSSPLPQPAHQRAGAPVDEPRHQSLVQGVRQPILQRRASALANAPGRPASPGGWRR